MFPARRPRVAIFAPAALLLLAACQGGGTSPSTAASAAAPTPSQAAVGSMEPSAAASASAATVTAATSGSLGDYLAGPDGKTVYVFLNDSPGTTTCYDSCQQTWPPLLVDAGATPTAGDGITATLGTIQRDDGSTQVTLDGWPLYFFAGDGAAGDTNGQGLNNIWYVARPDGSVPGATASSAGLYDYRR